MTGEVYAALLDATIIGRLAEGDDFDQAGFEAGARMSIMSGDDSGRPGDLLKMMFSARTWVLAGEMKPTAVRSYLSGLLIGAEVVSGLSCARAILQGSEQGNEREDHIFLLAEEPLLSRYKSVAALAGAAATIVAENPVAKAHMVIARHAGMLQQ
jgi:2-dehydro-3-deoxygalactonokinase